MRRPKDLHHIELGVSQLGAERPHMVIPDSELHRFIDTAGCNRFQLAGSNAGDQENQNGNFHQSVHAQSDVLNEQTSFQSFTFAGS